MANKKAKYVTNPSDNDTEIWRIQEHIIELLQEALSSSEADIPYAPIFSNYIKPGFFEEEERTSYKNLLTKLDLQNQESNLISTNHPINQLRYFKAYTKEIERNNLNTQKLIKLVEDYLTKQDYNDKSLLLMLKEYPEKPNKKNRKAILDILNDNTKKLLLEPSEYPQSENLTTLLYELKNLINLSSEQYNRGNFFKCLFNWLFDKNSTLRLSAIETNITRCINGISSSNCKSGKDRTGIYSMELDARIIFQKINKRPPIENKKEDRKYMSSIIIKLYESGHHQKHAAQNAPGASGLIGSNFSLPKECSSLCLSRIKRETRLGKLNKPHKKTSKFVIIKERIKNRIIKIKDWFLSCIYPKKYTLLTGETNLPPVDQSSSSSPIIEETPCEIKNVRKNDPVEKSTPEEQKQSMTLGKTS